MPTAASMSAAVMLAGDVQPEPALGWVGREAGNLIRTGRSFRRLSLIAAPESNNHSASVSEMGSRKAPLTLCNLTLFKCLPKTSASCEYVPKGF